MHDEVQAPAGADTDHTAPPSAPLRSVHTTSFPQLLKELGLSILVSTYQAGKLVIVRSDGDLLNTHFRTFHKPMGLALQGGRLAIGTELEVRSFRNVPATARALEPAGKHDADAATREYAKVEAVRKKVDEVAAEAGQCVGESAGGDGETGVDVLAQPELEEASRLEQQTIPGVRPAAASPTR